MAERAQKANRSGAAIVCVHVARDCLPILRARRDEPARPEDTGWQFTCGTRAHDSAEDGRVWGLDEVLRREKTLVAEVQRPAGTVLVREGRGAPWRVGE